MTSKINWKTVKRKIHFVCKKTEKFSFFVFFQFYFSENINISEKNCFFFSTFVVVLCFNFAQLIFTRKKHEENPFVSCERAKWKFILSQNRMHFPTCICFPYGWNFGRLFFINCLLHVFLVFPFVLFSCPDLGDTKFLSFTYMVVLDE